MQVPQKMAVWIGGNWGLEPLVLVEGRWEAIPEPPKSKPPTRGKPRCEGIQGYARQRGVTDAGHFGAPGGPVLSAAWLVVGDTRFPTCALLPFLGGSVPLLKNCLQKKGNYPYSSLSTGGPRI